MARSLSEFVASLFATREPKRLTIELSVFFLVDFFDIDNFKSGETPTSPKILLGLVARACEAPPPLKSLLLLSSRNAMRHALPEHYSK